MPFGLMKSVTGRLEKVDIALATMGGVVEQQLADCITALERRDQNLAREVCTRDAAVDDHERDIEQQVVAILEERHPTGAALRRALTAMKIASEMERIGDLSKNIARRSIAISSDPHEDALRVIPVAAKMGRQSLSQFSEALDSLFKGNPQAAKAVRESDSRIDTLYNSIFREVLSTMGQENGGILLGTHLVFVAKNFERIGDHATNIAERVHYSLTGEVLSGDRLKNDATSMATITAH